MTLQHQVKIVLQAHGIIKDFLYNSQYNVKNTIEMTTDARIWYSWAEFRGLPPGCLPA